MLNEELTDYEAERAARIAANRARLAALGVLDAAAGLQAAADPKLPLQRLKREKRLKTEVDPLPRRAPSGRIAAAGARDYSERRSFRSLFFSSSSSSPGSSPSAAALQRIRGPPRVPSSCHSCRQKREEMSSTGEGEGSNCWRCDGARGRFCRNCLSMRYGLSLEAIKLANERAAEDFERMKIEGKGEEGKEAAAAGGEEEEARDGGESKEEEEEEEGGKLPSPSSSSSPSSSLLPNPCGWLCPHCYEDVFGSAHGWICNSSLCMKRRAVPLRPTGVAVFESRAAGHASVAHALQAKLLSENGGNSSSSMVGPRKEGLGCVIEGETDLATVERRRAEEKEMRRRNAATAPAAAAPAPPPPPPRSSSPPRSSRSPSSAQKKKGKENVVEENTAAKRPRGRPPKSAGGGGARAGSAAPLSALAQPAA